MKRLHWQFELGLILVLVSVLFYIGHYFLFHDAHHIWIFLVGDIAFVPVEVLLVTLIIHRMLNAREKRAMLQKMNMVIGTFFSEVGNDLIRRLTAHDRKVEGIRESLTVRSYWEAGEFKKLEGTLAGHDFELDIRVGDRAGLQTFLVDKRRFLLSLLENPNLLEHDDFTDLLWAVFHLTEELIARKDVRRLPDEDLDHLSGDMKRVYRSLVEQWLAYMRHLKESYPYLFSLALRLNPFDPEATPVVG